MMLSAERIIILFNKKDARKGIYDKYNYQQKQAKK